MAKISKIKYTIQGVEKVVNVHVNSSGIFSVLIPDEMKEFSSVKELINNSLSQLNRDFNKLVFDYKTHETKQELFIIVAYHARGCYIERADGGHLFYYNDDKYKIDVTFSDIKNAIGLDFEVIIKESINEKYTYFLSRLNNGIYEKTLKLSSSFLNRGKIIPFTNESLNTLIEVQEKFKSLSQMLFEFINKDVKEIESILINKKLLN